MKIEKFKIEVPPEANKQRVFAMPESLKDLYQDEKDPSRIASASASGASSSAVAPSTSVSIDF